LPPLYKGICAKTRNKNIKIDKKKMKLNENISNHISIEKNIDEQHLKNNT
jgi:hypothetical protein